MLYLGGKGRLGRPIAEVILAATSRRGHLLEPFFGGGNSFKYLAPHFERTSVGDTHGELMLMWKAAVGGWVPPTVVSEEEYRTQRQAPPSALRGFVGFGCSFGAKWWGGYARSVRLVVRNASRSVVEISGLMKSTELRQISFDEWEVGPETVVYADPPYQGTTKYQGDFDHEHFWQVMDRWVYAGAHVFVSEYTAPSHWREIWMMEQRRKVSGGTGKMTCERLWTR